MAANLTKKMLATPVQILSDKEETTAAIGTCPYCDRKLIDVKEEGVPMKLCTHCLFMYWIAEVG